MQIETEDVILSPGILKTFWEERRSWYERMCGRDETSATEFANQATERLVRAILVGMGWPDDGVSKHLAHEVRAYALKPNGPGLASRSVEQSGGHVKEMIAAESFHRTRGAGGYPKRARGVALLLRQPMERGARCPALLF